MAEIVRTTLTDHRKKAVNVQLVTEALYGPQVRCRLSGLDYCPDDVVNIWEAVSESDGRYFLEMKTGVWLEMPPPRRHGLALRDDCHRRIRDDDRAHGSACSAPGGGLSASREQERQAGAS